MTRRELCFENIVAEQLEAMRVDVPRFDDMMHAVEEVLCTAPEAFPTIPRTKLSFCRTNEFVGTNFAGVPSLSIYFYYDHGTVNIISVEQSEGESYGL